ncbi:hypothetical protein PHMEG_00026368 [Phytophthora megakarya]|uniref:M96 mating-specific protein n=1 Tax=Phytophthora megakarya TaxID=4795 RepID=A0A225V9V9_9STRA|nr:hypothetical protein PHMEG_00026368 [Phytophthora megakarya]
MAFLQEDDSAFVAALSFLDEFAHGGQSEGTATPRVSALHEYKSVVNSTDSAVSSKTQSKPKHSRRRAAVETEEEKARRKAELNAKRKVLRKAGVYGDANRARNERSREIAHLRDQMKKLLLDLHILQTRSETRDEKQKQDFDDPYTLIADLKKEIFSNSSRADIRVKQAMRRYVEEDRDIIAWTSRTVPIEIKNKLFLGLTYHLRGYAITKRSSDSTPDRELSVLQLCYMVSIDQDIETTYGHDDVRTITDFMIVSLGQHMRGHREFIENALVDATNECSSLMTLAQSKHHVVDVLRLRDGVEEYEGLVRRLDASYANVDEVFMSNGLAGMTISPIDIHVREGVYGNNFELSSYKVLPFDVHSTAEAAWRHFKGVEKHLGNGSLYEKAEKDFDDPYTLIADLKKEIFSNSSRADIRVKQAIRRYVEEDRDVIAWTSRVVPIEIKNKLLRGLTYHLRGYAITKRSSDSIPDRELSVLQLCYMVSIDQDIETTYGHDDVRTITDFMIVSLGQNMRGHREFIENALVDTTLAGC